MADKILIVDDNKDLNDLLVELLSGSGYVCKSAYDGREAIESYESFSPDVVILDLNLPVVHGFDVLSHIKSKNPFTVVIILTGHGNETNAVRAIKLGADDYLSKPVTKADLLSEIDKNLKRSRGEKEVENQVAWPVEVMDHWMGRIFLDAPAALLHVDPTDNIRVVNRYAARILLLGPEQLFGQHIARIFPPDAGLGLVERIRKVVSSKARGYEGEHLLLRGDGEYFPALVCVVERPDKGHLLVSISDLTTQKNLERQYSDSKRLASLGRVVEGVAHEVRNPIIALGGFTRKLLRLADEKDREKQYLGIILKEVERVERMVNDIEEYVAFAQSRPKNFEIVNICQVVEEAAVIVEKGLATPEIYEKVIHLPDQCVVYGDRGLLVDLFCALIKNAYEAMLDGGRLEITISYIDGWVYVKIKDNGTGIKEEDLSDIFNPFVTSKTSGSGLGLAKAYMIVEDHSGHMKYKSKVGEGTTCIVTLPLERRKIGRKST